MPEMKLLEWDGTKSERVESDRIFSGPCTGVGVDCYLGNLVTDTPTVSFMIHWCCFEIHVAIHWFTVGLKSKLKKLPNYFVFCRAASSLLLLWGLCCDVQIRNKETQQCLDSMGRKAGEKLGLLACHGMGGNQASQIVPVDHLLLFFFHFILLCNKQSRQMRDINHREVQEQKYYKRIQ